MRRLEDSELSAVRLRWRRFWQITRPIATWGLSIGLVAVILILGVHYVLSHYVYAVDEEDPTPYEVIIPPDSSASKIADLLYHACGENQKGLIVSTASFKVYVDFIGKANSLKAGTYILSKNMTIAEIVDILAEGNPPRQTKRFMVPEGYKVEDIAALLVREELLSDADTFNALCKDPELFSKYPFISELPNKSERRYVLEGYLFPDTYEIYLDATPEEILEKMLTRGYEVYMDEWVTRAAELDMTRDQIITLASIIQKEAGVPEDLAKVSAVFHNRLEQGMKLESCATLSYVTGVNRYTFTEDEKKMVSSYNTYLNDGLPIGPICNPGAAAIRAALYPDESFIEEGYLFFCNGNPQESRALLFSKTYEEHQQKVEEYRKYWN